VLRAVLGGLVLSEQQEHLELQILEVVPTPTLEQQELAAPLVWEGEASSSLPKPFPVLEHLLVRGRTELQETQELLGIASRETQDTTLVDIIQAGMLQVIIQGDMAQGTIQAVTTRPEPFIILRTIRRQIVSMISITMQYVMLITQDTITLVTNIRILETHTLEIHSTIRIPEIHSIIHTQEIRTQEIHSTIRRMPVERVMRAMQETQETPGVW
jgi:hypothetical protein